LGCGLGGLVRLDTHQRRLRYRREVGHEHRGLHRTFLINHRGLEDHAAGAALQIHHCAHK
ncbi:hypothetical protein, partial [Paenibacillus borealis]|uniref:hypothetical protein n=1 Tax=Paenibacillus borealis TaxID=160799 RepID=UPI0015C35539